MKRTLGILMAGIIAAIPLAASANSFFSGGSEYALPQGQTVAGNLFVAGSAVNVGGDVNGDLFAAGGVITVTGHVTGNIIALGGAIVMDGRVDGDLLVAGGTAAIGGTVQGGVYGRVRNLTMGPNAQVHGPLAYKTMAPRTMRVGSVSMKAVAWAILGILTAMELLAFFGMTGLLVWRWPRWSLSVLQEARDTFWPSVGRGLVYGFLVPVGAVLLLMSFIGSLAGALALLAYVAIGILAKVLSGMLVGAWLSAATAKRAALQVTWANALGGVLLIHLITLIPLFGFLVQTLTALAVFGVLAHTVQNRLSLR